MIIMIIKMNVIVIVNEEILLRNYVPPGDFKNHAQLKILSSAFKKILM